MPSRRSLVWLAGLSLLALGGVFGRPYLNAASVIVRVANTGGRAEAWANWYAYDVAIEPRHQVPTRHGSVAAQFYTPATTIHRTVLLVPGIHSMGIEEPRLAALARDMAGAGIRVMAMALPDLQRYRITPEATDVIEDAVAWMAGQHGLAPDGRVGILGVSFAGGLAIVASSRDTIRERVAFVVSFGGHGDMPRVMRYLATGQAPEVPGLIAHPPHDYGVAVILFSLADRGVVPDDQVAALRAGIETFLLASQLTLVSMDQANATFAKARAMANDMPEPSRTYMGYVNDRAVAKLGAVLAPHLQQFGATDAALSPERTSRPPSARLFLLHGDNDTVIPAAETALLGAHLRGTGANVRMLLSGLITHAELDQSATAADAWKLVSFWADVLQQ